MLITSHEPTWRDSANCLGANSDLFFPEWGESGSEAKKICSECMVIGECLDDAVTMVERFGIRGGMTERERRRVRRERALATTAGARLK